MRYYMSYLLMYLALWIRILYWLSFTSFVAFSVDLKKQRKEVHHYLILSIIVREGYSFMKNLKNLAGKYWSRFCLICGCAIWLRY